MPRKSRPRDPAAIGEAAASEAPPGVEDRFELTAIRQDGSRFSAAVSVKTLRDERAAIVGHLLVGADGATRERLDQALHESGVDLQVARSDAGMTALRSTLSFAGMSHELRSPLTAMLGFAQLMASESPVPADGRMEGLDKITRAGWHLLKLVDEILDLEKIATGTLELSPESVSPTEILAECRDAIDGQAKPRDIHVALPPFAPPCRDQVHADRTRLRQVLVNLLSAAILQSPKRGTIGVSCGAGAPGRVRIGLRGGGVGWPPEKLGRVFRSPGRPEPEAGTLEGAGIGIVLARRLIQRMGGALGVEDGGAEGSLLWFDLAAAGSIR